MSALADLVKKSELRNVYQISLTWILGIGQKQ